MSADACTYPNCGAGPIVRSSTLGDFCAAHAGGDTVHVWDGPVPAPASNLDAAYDELAAVSSTVADAAEAPDAGAGAAYLTAAGVLLGAAGALMRKAIDGEEPSFAEAAVLSQLGTLMGGTL